MDSLDTLILGIIQGATEFLPISSSAHLVITQALLGVEFPGLWVEVILHLGTLVSVLIYFRHDIGLLLRGFFTSGAGGTGARREAGQLILATLPAVGVALTLNDVVEAAFEEVKISGWMLLATTVILVSTKWRRGEVGEGLTWWQALVIGLAQAVAILPGISRSGITIAAGLWLGLSGHAAARFAFLLAIPAMIGAGLFKLVEVSEPTSQATAVLAVGFVVAAVVGYSVIAWLLRILGRGQLHYFAGYTFLVALMVIFWL
ncbi:MAG: undecaprenyl-diphosphate phosphatase [Fidelibacterota bacterium]|nr:MAG: undecaprenyl-diphosphate phosphatase [Candidatus Neomarinimicrobiota bacterium]